MSGIVRCTPICDPYSFFANAMNIGQNHAGDLVILDIVEEYTRRDLSFDADGLNACLGIFNALRFHAGLNLRGHIWGITCIGSTLILSWCHPKPARRRPIFPSWSWVSWKGPIRYWSHGQRTNFVKIDAPTGSMQWVPIQVYLRTGFSGAQQNPENAPRRLQLTGKCPNVMFFDQPALGRTNSNIDRSFSIKHLHRPPNSLPNSTREMYASIHVALDIFQLVHADLDCDTLGDHDLGDCVAILVGSVSQGPRLWYKFLLLKPTGDAYRRVGLLTTPWTEAGSFERRFVFRRQVGLYEWSDNSPAVTAAWPRGSEPQWLRTAIERTLVVE
ncbi:hypothetical protein K458DRAFT_390972 [Lentithecium fluviatile CBS 122367]|uniref:Heterokaryon incompatibility domain-containing protein n=1 Tax=Lentithecium fluviatile CBS 122367 TaxID=1168545 RepID=A0A6G1IWJ9_9PLEO|nr:hypothetical protein K458DRAFT_390972 [Lentithecium fluviatile CBS 122367]